MKGSGLHIAVVDDEAPMRRALCRLLGSYGHLVTEFEGGRAYMGAGPAHGIDCLILDLHMPGMTGFEVLEALARTVIAPPVIVISGQGLAGHRERAISLGASAYLLKPIDEAPLMEAIERCVDGPAS